MKLQILIMYLKLYSCFSSREIIRKIFLKHKNVYNNINNTKILKVTDYDFIINTKNTDISVISDLDKNVRSFFINAGPIRIIKQFGRNILNQYKTEEKDNLCTIIRENSILNMNIPYDNSNIKDFKFYMILAEYVVLKKLNSKDISAYVELCNYENLIEILNSIEIDDTDSDSENIEEYFSRLEGRMYIKKNTHKVQEYSVLENTDSLPYLLKCNYLFGSTPEIRNIHDLSKDIEKTNLKILENRFICAKLKYLKNYASNHSFDDFIKNIYPFYCTCKCSLSNCGSNFDFDGKKRTVPVIKLNIFERCKDEILKELDKKTDKLFDNVSRVHKKKDSGILAMIKKDIKSINQSNNVVEDSNEMYISAENVKIPVIDDLNEKGEKINEVDNLLEEKTQNTGFLENSSVHKKTSLNFYFDGNESPSASNLLSEKLSSLKEDFKSPSASNLLSEKSSIFTEDFKSPSASNLLSEKLSSLKEENISQEYHLIFKRKSEEAENINTKLKTRNFAKNHGREASIKKIRPPTFIKPNDVLEEIIKTTQNHSENINEITRTKTLFNDNVSQDISNLEDYVANDDLIIFSNSPCPRKNSVNKLFEILSNESLESINNENASTDINSFIPIQNNEKEQDYSTETNDILIGEGIDFPNDKTSEDSFSKIDIVTISDQSQEFVDPSRRLSKSDLKLDLINFNGENQYIDILNDRKTPSTADNMNLGSLSTTSTPDSYRDTNFDINGSLICTTPESSKSSNPVSSSSFSSDFMNDLYNKLTYESLRKPFIKEDTEVELINYNGSIIFTEAPNKCSSNSSVDDNTPDFDLNAYKKKLTKKKILLNMPTDNSNISSEEFVWRTNSVPLESDPEISLLETHLDDDISPSKSSSSLQFDEGFIGSGSCMSSGDSCDKIKSNGKSDSDGSDSHFNLAPLDDFIIDNSKKDPANILKKMSTMNMKSVKDQDLNSKMGDDIKKSDNFQFPVDRNCIFYNDDSSPELSPNYRRSKLSQHKKPSSDKKTTKVLITKASKDSLFSNSDNFLSDNEIQLNDSENETIGDAKDSIKDEKSHLKLLIENEESYLKSVSTNTILKQKIHNEVNISNGEAFLGKNNSLKKISEINHKLVELEKSMADANSLHKSAKLRYQNLFNEDTGKTIIYDDTDKIFKDFCQNNSNNKINNDNTVVCLTDNLNNKLYREKSCKSEYPIDILTKQDKDVVNFCKTDLKKQINDTKKVKLISDYVELNMKKSDEIVIEKEFDEKDVKSDSKTSQNYAEDGSNLKFHIVEVPDNKLEDIQDNKLEDIQDNKLEDIQDNKLEDIQDNKLEDIQDNKLEDVPDNKLEDVPDNKLEDVPDNKLEDVPDNKKSLPKLNIPNIHNTNDHFNLEINEQEYLEFSLGESSKSDSLKSLVYSNENHERSTEKVDLEESRNIGKKSFEKEEIQIYNHKYYFNKEEFKNKKEQTISTDNALEMKKKKSSIDKTSLKIEPVDCNNSTSISDSNNKKYFVLSMEEKESSSEVEIIEYETVTRKTGYPAEKLSTKNKEDENSDILSKLTNQINNREEKLSKGDTFGTDIIQEEIEYNKQEEIEYNKQEETEYNKQEETEYNKQEEIEYNKQEEFKHNKQEEIEYNEQEEIKTNKKEPDYFIKSGYSNSNYASINQENNNESKNTYFTDPKVCQTSIKEQSIPVNQNKDIHQSETEDSDSEVFSNDSLYSKKETISEDSLSDHKDTSRYVNYHKEIIEHSSEIRNESFETNPPKKPKETVGSKLENNNPKKSNLLVDVCVTDDSKKVFWYIGDERIKIDNKLLKPSLLSSSNKKDSTNKKMKSTKLGNRIRKTNIKSVYESSKINEEAINKDNSPKLDEFHKFKGEISSSVESCSSRKKLRIFKPKKIINKDNDDVIKINYNKCYICRNGFAISDSFVHKGCINYIERKRNMKLDDTKKNE
jgi:hypothetical protein